MGEQLANAIDLWSALARGAKALGAAGAYLPLGITEALREGVVSGELTWADGAIGREQPRSGATFAARAKRVDRAWAPVRRPSQLVDHLAIVALLGAPVSAPLFHAIASQLGLAA